jgi:hypothetical protein
LKRQPATLWICALKNKWGIPEVIVNTREGVDEDIIYI